MAAMESRGDGQNTTIGTYYAWHDVIEISITA
ncbi:MAG: hypothetical protein ACI97K_001481 [Glaciecola sp.]|jgi:hypothetical protein